MPQLHTQTKNLTHKVALCTMNDIVDEGGTMRLAREIVTLTWAQIEARRGIFIGASGYTIDDALEKRTHLITVRYRTDLEITSAAWIYEARLKSAPRWYKVIEILNDNSEFVSIWCRLAEQSDTATPPVAKLSGRMMPDGVEI
jgi:head-tail adaptor